MGYGGVGEKRVVGLGGDLREGHASSHSLVYLLGYLKRDKQNNRVFERRKEHLVNIRDRWLHYFGSLILGHNLYNIEDFEVIVHIFTNLQIFYK